MKLYIWILAALLGLSLTSCKETEEPTFVDNEQDRDADIITGDEYVYHIPVIFHVLYKDKNAIDENKNRTQYIHYARFEELIKNVNDLYEGKLYNFGKKDDAPSENIHVKFELARYDEKGNKLATPGVEYIQYNKEYPIDCNQFMTTRKGSQKIIWDPTEYVNVMVYNFKETESSSITLGISNLPYQQNGYPQIEGLEDASKYNSQLSKNSINFEYCVSLNSLFIYSESTRYTDGKHGQEGYTYSSTDANVTFAHELGHFLGLHHVFAEKDTENGKEQLDNCEDTDFCKDTKSYNKPAYEKWLTEYVDNHKKENKPLDMRELIKRNNDKGEEWDSDNFMDYSVSLSFRFTPEQKDRMRQVLYYSPLIPGPKKVANTPSRSYVPTSNQELPIRLAREEYIPKQRLKALKANHIIQKNQSSQYIQK